LGAAGGSVSGLDAGWGGGVSVLGLDGFSKYLLLCAGAKHFYWVREFFVTEDIALAESN
jgi:hypothetical protein